MPDDKTINRDPRSGVLRIDVPPGAYGAEVDKASALMQDIKRAAYDAKVREMEAAERRREQASP
jgi:hypothetical protein